MKPAASGAWTLSTLFGGLDAEICGGDVAVEGLALDSRNVVAGDCFLAIKGTHQRGAHFVPQAVARGASAIAVEADEDLEAQDVPCVRVPELGAKVGLLAARLFDQPSLKLEIVAVTGTNGKTTVAHVCAQALTRMGRACGYVGTLGIGQPGQLVDTGMTTPDPLQLQAALAQMRDAGLQAVAMEASSHALAQARLNGTRIVVAVFTGLGHDHLDYHRDHAAYLAAKRSLFMHPGLRQAIFNLDDPVAGEMMSALEPDVDRWGFTLSPTTRATGVSEARTLRLIHADYQRHQSSLTIGLDSMQVQVTSRLVGDFNAQNLMACLAVLVACGFPLEEAALALEACEPVEGRMERLGERGQPDVFIDFAHSPDSLERVLRVLRGFGPRQLICVFGCGGDRDRTKRAPMGRIAESLADRVFITSDNPRSESAEAIARDILAGATLPERIAVVPERRLAIIQALETAGPDDIVLVAGKGHEKTQEIAGVKYPCSDRDVVMQWLQSP